ncbi:fimbrial protein [Serratia sp. NPDC078593]|uniref:fimbrial protein n=1 Tax=unclassified Serratia (in: enterobacteria) TaxID=2647522 RepID=UPI0037CF9341
MLIKLLAVMPFIVFSSAVFSEPDNTCWGDPVNIAVVDIGSAPFSSNEQGATATVSYNMLNNGFSGVCNNKEGLNGYMTYYVDMGERLIPSDLKRNYYKLSDDVDIRIYTDTGIGKKGIFFPAKPADGLLGSKYPSKGENVLEKGVFSVAGKGLIYLTLRRDIIGGAIVIPSDTVLFSAYRVMNITPYPPRPSRPLVQARTKPGGAVIPITPVCKINNGKTIEVDFGTLQTTHVATSISERGYGKNVALKFSCNTNLSQDIQVKLVSDTPYFSSDYIRSDNPELGIALSHGNKLVKPHQSLLARLYNGSGDAMISVMPVKNTRGILKGGEFNASAILVILSI